MHNKNRDEHDKDIKDIFSGMESFMKKPLNIEDPIMEKIKYEKDYDHELKVLRKKVRNGQLVLLVHGCILVLLFLLPVFGQNTIWLDEETAFNMLPTLYSLLVLVLGFSYMRIKTQSNQSWPTGLAQ